MSGGDYHVEVHGSVGGNLVVGDHNLIVNAAVGSSVTVLQEGERPAPALRSDVRVLPRRPDGFVGRTAELAAISAAVAARSAMQVHGPNGVGKSSLLRQAAHAVKGGVVFVTASGRDVDDTLQEIFEACYQTSGYRPSPTDLRRLMTGVGVCVVADDLVASDDVLARILDTAPDAAFVFSAPDRELWGQGGTIALSGLPEDEALVLFRREFGRDLTSAEVAAASRSWRESDRLPIAMLRSAAILAATPPPVVPAIPQQRDPQDPERTVALPVPLTAPQRDAYDLLRALPQGAVSLTAMARLVGAPATAPVREAAERLVEVGLAVADADTYRLPTDLLAAPVEYRRDPGELAAAMVEWLSDPDTSATHVAANGTVIIGLVNASVAAGQARAGCRLARAAAAMLALSLRWGLWRDLLVAGQAAATACDDKEALAYFTHERGIRMLCLGQTAAAAGLLAAAAGMWQALGLSEPATLAQHAQAIASSAGGGPAPASAAPPAQLAMPPAAGQAPAPHPPRPARRFIGRAAAPHRLAQPGGGLPILWILLAALVVVVLLAVALIVLLGERERVHSAPTPIRATIATSDATAGPTPSPRPFAYSAFARDGNDPSLVLDNDASTVWISQPERSPATRVWVAIDVGVVANMSGVTVSPAANGAGFPVSFDLEYSLDNTAWQIVPGQEHDAANPLPAGPQTITFTQPVRARYLRLIANQLWSGSPLTANASASRTFVMAIAELHVIS